jgi:hypothetical protein
LFVCFYLFACSFFPVDFFGFFVLFCYCGFYVFIFISIFFFLFLDYQLYHHHTKWPYKQQPPHCFPYSLTLLPISTFSAPYPSPQILIASITYIIPLPPPTPTAYRYYNQGIFYITHKLLVGY